MAGIYIHVPFCMSKCRYCGFYSVGGFRSVPQSYVDALIEDAILQSFDWKMIRFDSIYLGGGTPSLLSPDQMRRLLEVLREGYWISDHAEITLECNPATIRKQSLHEIRALGVNRLSIGVQSLDSRDLVLLGRKHGPMDSVKLLRDARESGFDNLSADLIIGIPGQRSESLEWTVRRLAGLVDHISAYILSVESGTELKKMIDQGKITEQGEDRLVFLYNLMSVLLEELGFERYEISNWCRSGRRSQHNLNYWLGGDYLGIGAGAHSHRDGKRWARIANWSCYVDGVLDGRDTTEFWEELSLDERIMEEICLRLRTSEGLDLSRLTDRLKRSNLCEVDNFLAKMDCLCKSGHLISRDGRILVSSKGAIVENEIVTYLLTAS
ncbi:MAG: radical SAM family heme chaperone HemW [bacterium]